MKTNHLLDLDKFSFGIIVAKAMNLVDIHQERVFSMSLRVSSTAQTQKQQPETPYTKIKMHKASPFAFYWKLRYCVLVLYWI